MLTEELVRMFREGYLLPGNGCDARGSLAKSAGQLTCAFAYFSGVRSG